MAAIDGEKYAVLCCAALCDATCAGRYAGRQDGRRGLGTRLRACVHRSCMYLSIQNSSTLEHPEEFVCVRRLGSSFGQQSTSHAQTR